MTDPDTTEAKATTLSAIAAGSARIETLLDEANYSGIVQVAEAIDDLCRGFESLAEAERALDYE